MITLKVPTRQCSPLTHQWVGVTLWGHTAAQWRMPEESLQRLWLYQVRVEPLQHDISTLQCLNHCYNERPVHILTSGFLIQRFLISKCIQWINYRSAPQIRPPFCNLSLSTNRRGGAYMRDATSLATTPSLDLEIFSGSVGAGFALVLPFPQGDLVPDCQVGVSTRGGSGDLCAR